MLQLQHSTAGVLVREQLHSWLRSKQLHCSGWEESNCTPASNCSFLQIIEDNWSRSDAFHWRQITALRIALHFISRCCAVCCMDGDCYIAILLLCYCAIVLYGLRIESNFISVLCCVLYGWQHGSSEGNQGLCYSFLGRVASAITRLVGLYKAPPLSRDAQSSFQSWPRNVLHYQRLPATPLETDANLESNTSGVL